MKKISTGMIEAGVNAMARLQKTKQADEAVVAIIYNAMEAVRENEVRAEFKKPEPKPYVHQDWPCWYSGPEGDRKVFNAPEDVPEGWVPASLIAPPKRGPGRPKQTSA